MISNMKMDIFVLLFWFALPYFCIFVEGHRYYVSEQETQWGHCNCTLTLPTLDFKELGIFAETDHYENLSLPEKGLWIGLFQAQLSFSYVGCSKMNNSGAHIVQNISECRWKSHCNTFAIRKIDNEDIECKCFDISVFAGETECTSTCMSASADKYTCGQQGQQYFSVYTVENVPVSQCLDPCYTGKTNCLGYNNKLLSWIPCNGRLKRNIYCSDQPFYATDAKLNVVNAGNKSWERAGEKCFEQNHYPATFRHIDSSKISEAKLKRFQWTGVIRINSLLRLDEKTTTFEPIQYAYVTLDDMKVRFEDNGTIKRNSLCETPDLIRTTVASPDIHSTSTSKRTEMTTQDKAKRVETQIPTTGISAGVSSAVVLVILIVIIILLWKRGALGCFKGDTKTQPNKETPVQYIDTELTEPQTRDHSKPYHNQDYSMNEELPISTKNNYSGKQQRMDDNVDVNKVLNTDRNPHKNQQIAYVHNNTNHALDEYDHLNQSGFPDHVISQPINDYDSTTTAIGNSHEDTYNHLNERPNQRLYTEKIYGVQDKIKTTDIYNQLNERPEQKHIMEDMYGLHGEYETENEYDITVDTPVKCKDTSEKANIINYDIININGKDTM
ncbi:uncharacterized protein LOC128234856 isoform X1 [Mya arenaria]|uniref:uncharacterized protein LOC128234856 isoform X1 n=1 Tax=Mya arenaria TaxID=6604 RepID=UPI0022E1CCCF|nr:uncharacterized protein LOC128234856 isoform X1 [Mya arenaria]